jgi:hypothetical protein
VALSAVLQTEELRANTELPTTVDGVQVASPSFCVERLAVGLSIAARIFVVARCLGHNQSRSLNHTVPLRSICEEIDKRPVVLRTVTTTSVIVVSSAAVVAVI